MSAKAILSASVSVAPVYVEDVFSTFLYTGNGSTQTITNGIDLAGEGGLIWCKSRTNAFSAQLYDTARGAGFVMNSPVASPQSDLGATGVSFTSSGFTVGSSGGCNNNGSSLASWTFRKAAKFFDVVTYTGNGAGPNLISHSLGSAPGMVICKPLNSSNFYNGNWRVWHRGNGTNCVGGLELNTTAAAFYPSVSNSSSFTATTFDPLQVYDTGFNHANVNGATYVAYLFAHNAGGFGTAGTENVVSCGSYTGAGANLNINLGYEPQWVMIKSTTNETNWVMFDTMRGLPVSGDGKDLRPNVSDAEGDNPALSITSTGFLARTGMDGQVNANGYSYIYIAIRRGPMKTPTVGTSVFTPVVRAGTSSNITTTSIGFPPDLVISSQRTAWAGGDTAAWDRLRGANNVLRTNLTSAEFMGFTDNLTGFDAMTGVKLGVDSSAGWINLINGSDTYINWNFRRAPGFFDVVAFTGAGAGSFNHNLGVVPELIIVKQRATAGNSWGVYSAATGNTHWLALQATQAAVSDSTMWNNTTPTNTVFSIGSTSRFSGTCIAYLFATLAGVSKVGTYTGTGTTLQINCGFTAGARFVLIKRTDSTGDWYVWDTARGIISGNDPYLLLNSTAAEVTGTDYIDPLSSGFEISSTAPAAINANGGTYIFLAIA